MPITAAEIAYRLSGGAANANANLALGGAKSSVVSPANLFDDVSGDEGAAGDTEYRCFYVHNSNATLALQNAFIWLQTNTTGNRMSIGLGTSVLNGTEQTVANESTAPAGVVFTQPTNKAGGIALGSIPAGQSRAVWIRRVVAPAASANNDTYLLRTEGDTAA